MADSSQVYSDLTIFLQKKASKRLINTIFNVMPTLEFFFALNGAGKPGVEGLGRPKSRVLISGQDITKARQEKLFAEREYKPLVQKTSFGATDVKVMTDYDNDPTVSSWETNSVLKTFVQPRFKFTRLKMPYKVAHSDIRTVKATVTTEGQAAAAIGSVYDAEVKTRMADMLTLWNGMLWGSTAPTGSTAGYPSDQDANTWDNIFSIANALSASNTYGGVDRSLSVNSWWRGNTVSTAKAAIFEDLIDYCNYDLGLASKGLGVQLIVVGGTLFKKAKAEAKANSYQLMTGGIPEYPEFGFKREIIRIFSGNRPVYVIYDPAVPASCGAFLDPSTWTVAIAPEGNFKISTPSDQTKIEGGDEADTGTINSELMLVCEVPSANAYFTNLS